MPADYSVTMREEEARELEAKADARNYYGDYREAAVLRARAKAVREGKPDPGWS